VIYLYSAGSVVQLSAVSLSHQRFCTDSPAFVTATLSKQPIFCGIEITISPPYCGFPSLSHQLPDVVAAGVVVETVETVVLGKAMEVEVEGREVVVVFVGTVDVFEVVVPQETMIIEITIKHNNSTSAADFFIRTSYS
jgi:hypothetical protein